MSRAWTCDILIRTYWRDAAWLQLCLEAIAACARGFRTTIVVAPRHSAPWLKRLKPPLPIRLVLTDDYPDDYLGQQVTKLHADGFSDAEFICHVDSDCIFCRPTTPDDLVPDGRPWIVTTPGSRLGRHWPWRLPTEAFLGWPVTNDFMRRPPFIYPRWIYEALREHSRRAHGVELADYVMKQPPRGFSEFNALGAFAFARHHDAFTWIDESDPDQGEPYCRWYWSWGGLDARTRREIASLIAAGAARNARPDG